MERECSRTLAQQGDAGYYDESGRLYIVERLKQMIKCMDCQVVPAELEELILCHYADEIAEVSVVGLPHSDYGEAPAAAIVLSEVGGRQDLLTLAERIKATVASELLLQTNDADVDLRKSVFTMTSQELYNSCYKISSEMSENEAR
ncbi:hypothetical protein HPB49_007995 [Dermacentor silvarum]|uniref:Uncharacterized protein n=1 Tax=Dermacentor silvarum TaxID=543639 RepID=A0ACB8CWD6_DERSI|nr:hypothetical protein HPB49_007995 [Dermacentor silvarum]